MTWTPFGADANEHGILVDGTPDWMLASLRECFRAEFRTRESRSHGPAYYRNRTDRMRRMELQARMAGCSDLLAQRGVDEVFGAMSPEQRLRAVDWLIKDNCATRSRGNDELERVLHDAGSKWKVGLRDGIPGLELRVPAGVQLASESVMASSGQAGQLLSEAWHSAFGVNPDAEDAYEKAIKAVEEAGASVVAPKNRKATLGTMVADMKNQDDWRLPLETGSGDAPVRMAEALWQGQESRHGGNGYRKPTNGEAEAAVLLATPLVQWFCSGTLARRP